MYVCSLFIYSIVQYYLHFVLNVSDNIQIRHIVLKSNALNLKNYVAWVLRR